jgi:hypothetical protein
MQERTADRMHQEIAQATAEQAYGVAHQANRRAGRALLLSLVSAALSLAALFIAAKV